MGINMQRIAEFEKVSLEQFTKDWLKAFPDTQDVKSVYDSIKLPTRATVGSAGYDFFAPADVTIKTGESTLIPTGIRAKIDDGWVLSIFPRSGLGFKHRVGLDNTVGIIDADYYNSSNASYSSEPFLIHRMFDISNFKKCRIIKNLKDFLKR